MIRAGLVILFRVARSRLGVFSEFWIGKPLETSFRGFSNLGRGFRV